MDKFIALPEQDKRDAFQEVATRRGVLPIIIEKDFWVCWTLKQLYSIPELAEHITFKGGTSLSKAFGLIERFSEDIDLTISKAAPGFANIQDALEKGISGKELDRRIGKLKLGAQAFVSDIVLPKIKQKFISIFGNSNSWNIYLDNADKDKQTILFFYPKILEYNKVIDTPTFKTKSGTYKILTTGKSTVSFEGYIKPSIKLEFGARGDSTPFTIKEISPYIAEAFPGLFKNPICKVPTLTAERTFWEKATILHALHHGSKIRDRMSRHYYDTYMLTVKGVADVALKNLPLLEQVVKNKNVFFKDNKASYDTAKIGSLKLVPGKEMISELKADYIAMQEMFMAEAPDFDIIISTLASLEENINSLKE